MTRIKHIHTHTHSHVYIYRAKRQQDRLLAVVAGHKPRYIKMQIGFSRHYWYTHCAVSTTSRRNLRQRRDLSYLCAGRKRQCVGFSPCTRYRHYSRRATIYPGWYYTCRKKINKPGE